MRSKHLIYCFFWSSNKFEILQFREIVCIEAFPWFPVRFLLLSCPFLTMGQQWHRSCEVLVATAPRIPGKRGSVQASVGRVPGQTVTQLLGSIPKGLQGGSKFTERSIIHFYFLCWIASSVDPVTRVHMLGRVDAVAAKCCTNNLINV